MKIIKGKWYLCVDSISSCRLFKGNIYKANEEDKLTNDDGGSYTISECHLGQFKLFSPSSYILQRDLPELKAGAEFIKNNEHTYRYNSEIEEIVYGKGVVENNPEWFLPKKAEPKEFTESDLREFVYKYKYCAASKSDDWIKEFLEEKRKINQ
mgnify:CR=1 FL=1